MNRADQGPTIDGTSTKVVDGGGWGPPGTFCPNCGSTELHAEEDGRLGITLVDCGGCGIDFDPAHPANQNAEPDGRGIGDQPFGTELPPPGRGGMGGPDRPFGADRELRRRRKWNPFDAWRKYQVPAESVADFLARYYRADRYTGRGEDYAAVLLASYTREASEDGVCAISHHDSRTGEIVAWYPEGAEGQAAEVRS
jgi:hypothetical protein